LPTGVTGNYSGGNITISGTPTVSGTFNYTVTLTGGCGSTTATGTIIVKCLGSELYENSDELWKIYPNPSAGVFTIQSKNGGIFEMIDNNGKLLNTYHLKGSTDIIEVNIPGGLYYIREKETGRTQKLIIR
jgi:hypothetical protein